MASLVVQLPGAAPASVPLVKALTTVGSGSDSDVRVDEVRGVVAIQFDGSGYVATALEGAPLSVNGKKRDRAPLSDGDTLQLGRTRLQFHAEGRPAPDKRPPKGRAGLLTDVPELPALLIMVEQRRLRIGDVFFCLIYVVLRMPVRKEEV